MTNPTKITVVGITVFAITAAITIVVSSSINSLKTGRDRLWLISTVKVPGRMALEAIQSDLKAGRCDDAKTKLDALAATWHRFDSGPDSFQGRGIGDIMLTFSRLDATNGATASETNSKQTTDSSRRQP